MKLAHALGRVFVGGQVWLADTDRALLATLGGIAVDYVDHQLALIGDIAILVGGSDPEAQGKRVVGIGLIQAALLGHLIVAIQRQGDTQHCLSGVGTFTQHQYHAVALHPVFGGITIAGQPLEAWLQAIEIHMRQRITANIQRDLPLLGLTAGAFLETQARIDTKAGQLAVFDGHCHPGGAFQRVSVGVLGLQRQLDDYLFAIQGYIAALTAAAGALMIQWLQLLHFQRHLEALPVLLRLRRQAQHQGAVGQTPFDGALGVDREAQRFTAGAEFIAQLGQ
ncbi:hypothetical protein TUM17383_24350 [Shewanella algae]|nr:hypothetical protein TUM17383_24350 [Shewanella algae]